MREYRDYLTDIVDAISRVEEFVGDIQFADFEKDDKTVFAVIRALEIMGEAAKKVPATVRNKHKQIPWQKITGMRDKLIHEYFGVNTKVLWQTIKEDIPGIKPLMEQVVRNLLKNNSR